MRVTSQELWPTSLETLKVYSPPSLLSVLLILRTEVLSLLWTLYRWPETSSLPDFIQVALRGFVPEKRASSVAGSPWVTLIDLASSVILAGSEIWNKHLGSSILNKSHLKAAALTMSPRQAEPNDGAGCATRAWVFHTFIELCHADVVLLYWAQTGHTAYCCSSQFWSYAPRKIQTSWAWSTCTNAWLHMEQMYYWCDLTNLWPLKEQSRSGSPPDSEPGTSICLRVFFARL